jgi:ribosome biogenesis GTPase
MNIENLGYNSDIEAFIKTNNLQEFTIGRVMAEHKERYIVGTNDGTSEAEITGNLRFTANSKDDFPAVGDWVALLIYDNDFALIQHILPRRNTLSRRAIGKNTEKQIIATNIDYAFILQAVDRDFNINRIERYLTICKSSNINPLIVLSKTDLISSDQLNEQTKQIKSRTTNIPVMTISNQTMDGYDTIKSVIKQGKTYCLLGSSGVGKSSLVNNLSEKPTMKTDVISQHSNRGRHITSHRELILLESGGILIDNPGMREVGLTDSTNGIITTFNAITNIASNCKFKDCKHINEPDCAIIEAVTQGIIDRNSYENYLKLEKEKDHYESTIFEQRKKDKDLGKIIKDYKKVKKNNKSK